MLNDWFPKSVPPKPMGYFAHIVTLRVTDSYALFQTDGELNTARVQTGLVDASPMTRITMFKRKQTTPERLNGRELLRRYGLLSGENFVNDKRLVDDAGRPICDYNVRFCMTCPDCITYGFAIGDAGSEKSKVISDTAYSLTAYEHSHEAFTLNAPFEDGTMSRAGETSVRINEQDHVRPQVIFPGVITARDVTEPLFHYVVNNVLRTRRYGAQTTRTGSMTNHVVAIALTDGEIFSNLRLTWALYDVLARDGAIRPPDPVDVQVALRAAQVLVPDLLREDGVTVDRLLIGRELDGVLGELTARMASEDGMRELLAAAFADSQKYYTAWVAKQKK
jgi:CRISPR-associated protein Csc2